MLKLHKLTALFARTITDRIALVNHSWDHYAFIQQLEAKRYPVPIKKDMEKVEGIYVNFPSEITNKIGTIFDDNSPTAFQPLIEKNVIVRKSKKGDIFDTKQQKNPDNFFDFSKSEFTDKGVHGMDTKAYQNPIEFESRIFTQISKDTYKKSLDSFQNLIRANQANLSIVEIQNIRTALYELAKTCDDVVAHQLTWAQSLHHFPDNFIPPIRLPENFSKRDLKPEFQALLEKSEIKVRKISNILYMKKVPENDIKKAIELFEDTDMQ